MHDVLSLRERKELRGLKRREVRERLGRFSSEGIRVVEDLLASNLSVRLVVTASSLEDTPRGQALVSEVDRRAIPRRTLGDSEFEPFASTTTPQGVIAVAEMPRARIADLEHGELPRVVLVLDAVQDPGNFGAMVRSAEALGAAGVIALPGTVDPWNPKSVRAAAGSSFRVPILQLGWREVLEDLRSRGFAIYGASREGRAVETGIGERLALVVGNEGAGLSADVRASVNGLLAVPLRGRAESLNVAAAAAILLFELTR